MKIHYRSFLAGILIVIALKSIYQDLLGLDNYLEVVRRSWCDWKISVPSAITILLFIPYLLRKV
mgnify:CR=1 FL=1